MAVHEERRSNESDDMMSSLSPLAKTLVSVAAVAVEFKVVKDNVKAATTESKSWGEALLAIIPTCAAVGVAMYAMLGPWGLVATVAVGATAAIVGFVQGEAEMRKQLVHNTFYDGYGKKVSDLALEFGNLLDSSTKAFDVISEKQADILTAKDNISDTKTEIELLISEVTNGATAIEDAIPRMTQAFENLYNDSKTYLLGTASLLYAALTGSTLEGIEAYMQTISEITGTTIKEMDESRSRIEEAKKQWEAGTITDEMYWQIQIEETAKVSSLTSAKSNLKDTVSDALSGVSISELFSEGINWESNNLEGDLKKITKAAESAKKTIAEAYGGIYEDIAEYRGLAEKQGNMEAVGVFDNMLADFEAFEKADIDKVDTMLDGVVKELQKSLLEKMKGVFEAGKAEYANMNWFEQWWYGNASEYGSDMLDDFKKDEEKGLPAITKALTSVFGEDASLDSIDSSSMWSYIYGLSDELPEELRQAGTDTVAGLAKGLSDEGGTVYNATRDLGLSVLHTYEKVLDINSPSKEMQKRGEYSIEGLVIGLSDTTALDIAIDNIVKKFDILSPIKNSWSKVTDWWKGISLPDLNLGAKISASMGDTFIPKARASELVSRISSKNASANNGHIDSIARAVYEAMMAAKEDGDGDGTPARIVVQIGETPIGEAAVKFINGQIIQTGVSPIYS